MAPCYMEFSVIQYNTIVFTCWLKSAKLIIFKNVGWQLLVESSCQKTFETVKNGMYVSIIVYGSKA